MNLTALSTRELTLIAAYAAFVVIYFGCFFFGFRRALAGAAVVGGIVLIGLLPSAAALMALLAGFVGLVAVTTYHHNRATVFASGVVQVLQESAAGQACDRLRDGRSHEGV